MSVLRCPALRFSMEPVGEHEQALVLYDATGNEVLSTRRHITASLINHLRQRISDSLDEFRELASSSPSLLAVSRAVRCLNEAGLTVIGTLFRGQIRELEEAFRRHCPGWKGHGTGPTPRLVIAAELARILPLELLPFFDISTFSEPSVTNFSLLEGILRRFPGFSMIASREIPHTHSGRAQDSDRQIDNTGGLCVALFSNTHLQHFAAESQFFQDNEPRIALQGPWPPIDQRSTRENVIAALAHSILYCSGELDCSKELGQVNTPASGPLHHIHHFGCHSSPNLQDVFNSCVELTHGGEVTLGQLIGNIAGLERTYGPRSRRFGPLVFMNSCQSGQLGSEVSFPWFFMDYNRNMSFIGTEINVNDRFAAFFSQAFYSQLLRGDSVGEALHKAKWLPFRMSDQGRYQIGSPLGIIYHVYGDLDIRLRNLVV